jgi:hypothetical protein
MRSVHFSLLLTLLLVGCSGGPADDFAGHWVVDRQATLQTMRESPEWDQLNEQQRAFYNKQLPGVMEAMRLEITPDIITYTTGDQQTAFACETVEIARGRWLIDAKVHGVPSRLTLTLDEAGRLRLKSDRSVELDYYRWRRVEP